jgi:hypothetical protein
MLRHHDDRVEVISCDSFGSYSSKVLAITPHSFAFAVVLAVSFACGDLQDLRHGRAVHDETVGGGKSLNPRRFYLKGYAARAAGYRALARKI